MSGQESETQDIILLTIADTDIAKNAAAPVLPVSILFLVGLWMISLGYVYSTSRQLTKTNPTASALHGDNSFR